MLPSSLVLLVALVLASATGASPAVAVPPPSSLLASPPRLALPVLDARTGSAGGQRISLVAHSLDRPAFGRGGRLGAGPQLGDTGLRRRAASADGEDAELDDDVLWAALGWSQAGGSYSVPIEVGTSPHTFYLQIDTASSDLLVASTLCLSSASCKALLSDRLPAAVSQELTSPSTPYVELYNPDVSSSFVSVNGNASRFLSTYADGTAAGGFAAKERVAWGGVVGPQAGRLVLDDQAIGVVNATNLTLAAERVSGLFGLGPPRLSALAPLFDDAGDEGAPVLSRLARNGSLGAPLFGLHLEKNTTLGGSLTLGAVDGDLVRDQSLLQWHPVVPFPPFNGAARQNESSPFLQWAVQLTNVTVNGTDPAKLFSAAYPETRNETYALLDSGASGIFGPIEDVEYLFSRVDGSRMVSDGLWLVPCSTRATLTFAFGGRDYVLQPSEWLIGRVSTNQQECLAWPVGVAPSGDGIGWQLGTPFLRTVYSVFHMGIDGIQAPLVGFLPLHNATSLAETPANVSSLLDSTAFITTVLPNVLLPTPTYYTPPYIFNTSAWYTTTTSAGATQTITTLPTATDGLGAAANYTALPLAPGASVTTLPPGFSGLPTAGPVDSSVIDQLQSARESIASVASVTWGAGLASDTGPARTVARSLVGAGLLAALACVL